MKLLRYVLSPLIATTRLVLLGRALMAMNENGPDPGDPHGPDPLPYGSNGPPPPPPPPPPAPPEFPTQGTSNSPDAKYYAGEDEFILGSDGLIYQRQREGFRTVGWRAVGRQDNLAAAAQVAGVSQGVFVNEIRQQQQRQQQTEWQLANSGYNGLTNQQLQEQAQTGSAYYDTLDQAWNAAQSGYNGLTNYQLQQQNKTSAANVAANDYAWKMATASWQPSMMATPGSSAPSVPGAPSGIPGLPAGRAGGSGASGSYAPSGSSAPAPATATASGSGPLTNQQLEQQLAAMKDRYSWGETDYGLSTQAAQHALEDKQRDLQTQQTTFNLGQEAQRQEVARFKQNQDQYEQQQGAKNRDMTGFGFAAMNPSQATRLAGQ